MPPGMSARNGPGEETPPEGIPVATGGIRNGPIDSESDDDLAHARPSRRQRAAVQEVHRNLVSPLGSEDEDNDQDDDEDFEVARISDIPPSLPGIELGEGIELPSRLPSKASSKPARKAKLTDIPLVPSVPRKSSRRQSQSVDFTPVVISHQHSSQTSIDSSRLPFERSNSNKRQSTISTKSSTATTEDPSHTRNSSSALGNFSADVRGDRPTSVGYVHHHNIRTINPLENPEYLGSSAEVVNERYCGASSFENPPRQ